MLSCNNKQRGPRSGIGILIQALFVLVIWAPNLTFIKSYCPYLISDKILQSKLLVNDFAFIDATKYYARVQIAKTSPQDISEPRALQRWFKQYMRASNLTDGEIEKKVSYAPYTPQSIIFCMPFRNFPLNQWIIFLEILTLVLLIVPTTVLIKQRFDFKASQIFYWWLIVLAAAPTTITFYFGQLDGILVGLEAIFLLAWRNKNCLPAALSFALVLATKPQRAIIMLTMALAAKRLRLLGWAFLISIILLLITIAILGLDNVLAYPGKLQSIQRAIDNHQVLEDYVSLAVGILAPISLIFGLPVAHTMSFPLTILCLGGAFLIWHKAVKSGEHTYPFAYASSTLLILLLAPFQHFYSLILLCLVWAYTVPVISIKNILMIQQATLRYWCFLFLSFPALTWIIAYVLGVLCKMPGLGHLPLVTLLFILSLSNFFNALKSKMVSKPISINP